MITLLDLFVALGCFRTYAEQGDPRVLDSHIGPGPRNAQRSEAKHQRRPTVQIASNVHQNGVRGQAKEWTTYAGALQAFHQAQREDSAGHRRAGGTRGGNNICIAALDQSSCDEHRCLGLGPQRTKRVLVIANPIFGWHDADGKARDVVVRQFLFHWALVSHQYYFYIGRLGGQHGALHRFDRTVVSAHGVQCYPNRPCAIIRLCLHSVPLVRPRRLKESARPFAKGS